MIQLLQNILLFFLEYIEKLRPYPLHFIPGFITRSIILFMMQLLQHFSENYIEYVFEKWFLEQIWKLFELLVGLSLLYCTWFYDLDTTRTASLLKNMNGAMDGVDFEESVISLMEFHNSVEIPPLK